MDGDELYQVIADYLYPYLPQHWATAVLRCDMSDDRPILRYFVLDGVNAMGQLDVLGSQGLIKAFKDLRTKMVVKNAEMWHSALFTLNCDGTFNVEFYYPD